MGERPPHETSGATDPASWVERYGDYLYRYALARLGRPDVAEDVVQETFLGALRGREQFQGASSERTWLVGILKRKVIDHLRRKHREQPAADLGGDVWETELFDRGGHWKRMPREWSDPSMAIENAEFWKAFGRCRDGLPGRLAEAFSLREVDGLDGAEICEALAVTSTNLSVMLHRARLRLWRCLSASWFGGERGRS